MTPHALQDKLVMGSDNEESYSAIKATRIALVLMHERWYIDGHAQSIRYFALAQYDKRGLGLYR
jgi:hypothetical protein